MLLAGGLHPGNAREAFERVQPAGLDVCSGLRLNGRLDAAKLRDFFRRHPLTPREIPMIGYVSVGTNDWKRALAFYDTLMAELGAKRVMDFETFVAWSQGKGKPGFALAQPHNKKPATVGNGSMVAFQVDKPEQVDALYKKAHVARRDRRRAARRPRRQLLRRLLPRPRRQQAELPLLDMTGKAFAISTVAGWADMDANAHMANFAYLNKCVDARMSFFKQHGFPVTEFAKRQDRAGRAARRARVLPRNRPARADHGDARACRHGAGRLALPAA